MKSPHQLLSRLEFIEVGVGGYDAQTIRMMRAERESLASALRSGDAGAIKSATEEARRVAKMWNVNLDD